LNLLISVFAVVVDHVVISDPRQLSEFGIAQLAIGGGCPPVGCGVGSTLTDAKTAVSCKPLP